MTTKRHPASETHRVVRDNDTVMFICGIQIEPNHADPVSMAARFHPGFGSVTLLRNSQTVDADYVGTDEGGHTLQWYENRAAKNPRARWEIEVNGPLSGYTMRRIRGNWYVTETNMGFA